MLKRYRNGFIEIIEKQGLSAASFKHYEKEVGDNPAFIMQLENTPMYFMARTNSDDYRELDLRYIKFAPGYPQSDYIPYDGWADIDSIYENFQYWLVKHVGFYIDEIDEPDLWEQIDRQQLFDIDPSMERSTDSFDKVEKQNIRNAIESFSSKLVEDYKPTQDQLEVITERLGYLSEALDRQNKTDWQSIAMSTLISISITLSLDTEKGKSLFELFKEAFNSSTKLISG